MFIFVGAIMAPQAKAPAPVSATPTARDLRPLVGEWRRDDLGAKLPCLTWWQRGKAAGDPGGRRSCW